MDNKKNINKRYKPTYHVSSLINWANDPNGVIWYNDEYHLFYQHNPYDSKWGPMHWGHASTKDFIKWTDHPIALAPDHDYDIELGAFSGTAIEIDNKLYLFYTSAMQGLQTQSLAVSSDGINFKKINANPVIGKIDYPKELNAGETRDPKIFKVDNTYYILLGTKENELGQVVMYKTSDLKTFEYVGPLLNNFDKTRKDFFELNGVYECPDYINLDGYEILISSPQFMPQKDYEHQNVHSNIYMVGTLDFKTGEFRYDNIHEMDGGFDFYAPQSTKLPDGRVVMIAWMQMWDRSMPTSNDNWVGSFTLPRVLNMRDGKLIQTPIEEIKNYRTNNVAYDNIIIPEEKSTSFDDVVGNTIELELELNSTKGGIFQLEILKGINNTTKIIYDVFENTLTFDRSNSGIVITGVEENLDTRTVRLDKKEDILKLRIFIDKSTVEIFINDGIKTLSSNIYPDENDINVSFTSLSGNFEIFKLNKYDILVGE